MIRLKKSIFSAILVALLAVGIAAGYGVAGSNANKENPATNAEIAALKAEITALNTEIKSLNATIEDMANAGEKVSAQDEKDKKFLFGDGELHLTQGKGF